MIVIVSSVICLAVIYLHLLSHEKTQEIYLGQTEKTVEELKKDFLKDTVNNIFLEIDRLRETKPDKDELVKEEIKDIIRGQEFSEDSYMWINKIVNYEGGENYAIRVVHPNLIETEGDYLSTSSEDAAGNFPYLEELEGVKKNGELFFKYYFKELNSPDISEKLTYAKLYKDYDWIIAMGVNLDVIGKYTEETNNEIQSLSSESSLRLLRYIFIVLLIGFTILYFIERSHFSSSTKSLQKEINFDILTKTYSRRYGEKSLEFYFEEYKLTGEKPAIMILDVDEFKDINDKYGHEAGDTALKEITNTLSKFIRSSDELIRWGGDEFICIFPGLREKNVLGYGEKLLCEISNLEIPIENEVISITTSVGFSYFRESDHNYKDVLKRADNAMYSSKKQGKNRVEIFL